jgi:DNA polymerase elongation subunit (family B)
MSTKLIVPKVITNKKPKIVFWDLETTNLNANFGYLLCTGYKELGDKKAKVISISDFPSFKSDPTNDKFLVEEFRKVLAEADVTLGWYSSRFDVPYMSSRLLYHGLDVLPPTPHIDLWRTARYKLRLNSNRLASVAAFLDLEEKTPLTGPIWIKAAAGDKKSIEYVKEHCLQDVEVLEQAYLKLRPLVAQHPNLGLMSGRDFHCPYCGSSKLQKRGFLVTPTRRYQRQHCQSCGAWSKDKKALETATTA